MSYIGCHRRARLLACLLAVAPACAHTPGGPQASTPAGMYSEGVEALEGGLYPEAQRAFEEIKVKHPYSRFAALAELRAADTHLRQQQYPEAIEGYRTFLKYHPTHEDAAYAQYSIGEAYFAQLPGTWWFMPPGAEKDPGNIGAAIAAYEGLLARPEVTGAMADTARAHLDACRRRLADHEMYVARFYLARGHYAAAAGRAEAVLAGYGGLGLDAEALWIVGRARAGTGEAGAAVAALRQLADAHADAPEAARGRALLQQLGGAAAPAPAG